MNYQSCKGKGSARFFLNEDCNLLIFALLKRMNNLNAICIMQYNIITTSIFKYLKLLSIGKNCVKRIPNHICHLFPNLYYFQEKH